MDILSIKNSCFSVCDKPMSYYKVTKSTILCTVQPMQKTGFTKSITSKVKSASQQQIHYQPLVRKDSCNESNTYYIHSHLKKKNHEIVEKHMFNQQFKNSCKSQNEQWKSSSCSRQCLFVAAQVCYGVS